jgi:hypothetical protein
LEDASEGEKAAWWPVIANVDWCGEHQPRAVEPEQPKAREPGWYVVTTTDDRPEVMWWNGEHFWLPKDKFDPTKIRSVDERGFDM